MTRDINDDSDDNHTLITAEHHYDPSIFSPSPSFGRGGDLEDTDYDDDDKLPRFGSDSGIAKPASTRSLPNKGMVRKVQSKHPSRNDNDRGDQNQIPCYQCVRSLLSGRHEDYGKCFKRISSASSRCWKCHTHTCSPLPAFLRPLAILLLELWDPATVEIPGNKTTLNKKKTRIAMSVMMALEEEQMDCVDLGRLPSPTHHLPSRQLARSSVSPSSRTRKRKASPPEPSVVKCMKVTPSGSGSRSQVIKETKRTRSTKGPKESKGKDKNVSSKVVDLDTSVDNSDDNDDVEDLEDRLLIMQLEFELKKKKRARALAARRR